MLLGITDLTFEFGARTIIKDATWHIQPGERIGLVGYNGVGKSTLFKILTAEYTPSKGSVEKSKETTIGYLHQDLLNFDTNDSILQVALGAFEQVLKLEKELEEIALELEETGDDNLGILYSEKLHELDVLGGYDIDYKTREVLQGLGFESKDVEKPYKNFSGGWRMRVLLAKMMLMAPDVLLLDEPTNHLDLPSIEWLERYLQGYKGAVVIISHDRFFLDKMVTKIIDVYQQELHFYGGNYSYFLIEKEQRMKLLKQAFDNQQDYIRQQERFIDRFKAKASKAAQAQSLVKKLDKLEKLEDVEIERPNIKINFTVDKQPGKVISTLKDVSKSFGDNIVMKTSSGEINRGDKIALIGANGKGKSTLLRIIAGTEEIVGESIKGHNVQEAFYAQHQLESLNLDNTILEEMLQSGSGKTEQEYRNLLGCFLFGGDDTSKKIKVLSGGEKARVALAKTIVSKANFLMLDEPTNHLDMHSVDLLVESLNRYEGTIVLVSHDRYFVSNVATRIWEIKDQQLVDFHGTYDELMEWNKRMEAKNTGSEKKNDTPKIITVKPDIKPVAKVVEQESISINKPINKEHQKEVQKKQKQLETIELELEQLSKQKNELETKLGDPEIYANMDSFKKAEAEYNAAEKKLELANINYEKVFEELMSIQDQKN